MKKKLELNKQLIWDSMINKLNTAYAEYKKAYYEFLRYTAFSKDGSFVYNQSLLEKLKLKEQDYARAYLEMDMLRAEMRNNNDNQ